MLKPTPLTRVDRRIRTPRPSIIQGASTRLFTARAQKLVLRRIEFFAAFPAFGLSDLCSPLLFSRSRPHDLSIRVLEQALFPELNTKTRAF
jgi:hypothetical protein